MRACVARAKGHRVVKFSGKTDKSRSPPSPCCQLSSKHTKMEVGTVKWFSDEKGYGFITPESGSADVFVHCRQIETSGGSLMEGDSVQYKVVQGAKGLQAENVTTIRN